MVVCICLTFLRKVLYLPSESKVESDRLLWWWTLSVTEQKYLQNNVRTCIGHVELDLVHESPHIIVSVVLYSTFVWAMVAWYKLLLSHIPLAYLWCTFVWSKLHISLSPNLNFYVAYTFSMVIFEGKRSFSFHKLNIVAHIIEVKFGLVFVQRRHACDVIWLDQPEEWIPHTSN